MGDWSLDGPRLGGVAKIVDESADCPLLRVPQGDSAGPWPTGTPGRNSPATCTAVAVTVARQGAAVARTLLRSCRYLGTGFRAPRPPGTSAARAVSCRASLQAWPHDSEPNRRRRAPDSAMTARGAVLDSASIATVHAPLEEYDAAARVQADAGGPRRNGYGRARTIGRRADGERLSRCARPPRDPLDRKGGPGIGFRTRPWRRARSPR